MPDRVERHARCLLGGGRLPLLRGLLRHESRVQGGLRFGVGHAVLRIVGDEEPLALMPANELFVAVVAESQAATLPHLGRRETVEGARGRLHLGWWRRRCRGRARGWCRKRQRGCAHRRWQREARGRPGQTGHGRQL
jgi:hypothetical protein